MAGGELVQVASLRPVTNAVGIRAIARRRKFCCARSRQSGCDIGRPRSHVTRGEAMYQVKWNEVWIGYAGSIAGAREIVRCELAGCYDVYEIRAEPFPAGIRQRHWG